MKKLILSLFLFSTLIFAQVSNNGSTSSAFGGTAVTSGAAATAQAQFDAAYRASLPPALQGYPIDATTATELALQGVTIDAAIQVYGWDPWTVMNMRLVLNETWVPSALQLPLGASNGYALPGVPVLPGQLPYPSVAPPGSIKVSVSLSDYPPFTVPTPTPTPAVTDPVGPWSYGKVYLPAKGDTSPGGTQYTDSRGTFTKFVVPTPFGNSSWWVLSK